MKTPKFLEIIRDSNGDVKLIDVFYTWLKVLFLVALVVLSTISFEYFFNN